MSNEDDQITSTHRGVTIRRVLLRNATDESGNRKPVWACKATIGSNVIVGQSHEDAILRIDHWLDRPGQGQEESPESFEYRTVSVRRIQRGAFSFGSQESSSRYAWRARVDAMGRSQSVSAESVAEIKEKIDAILDSP
jgi:hypothetical protein